MKSSRSFLSARSLKAKELGMVYKVLRAAYGHQNWWPGETSFEIITGAILTQNTAWRNVEKAIQNLKMARVLNPRAMSRLSHKKLAELIRPAGFFNIKARRLRNFLDFLEKDYQGSLSKMSREKGSFLRQKLLNVNGIGPETADSILLYAFQKPFFVIDAYTRRIFSRHNLLGKDESYAAWQELFTRHLPPRKTSLYNDYHAQIVETAKRYCRASQTFCQDCPLKIYF